MNKEGGWSEKIFSVLQNMEIRQAAYVPDAGHARLIELCHADARMKAVSLTTEEEGVALLAGAWLGGERGVLLMQSSGVGNCINMLAMLQECRIPFLTLVTMRGEWGEFNPWQVPMGQATSGLLRDIGVIVYRADTAEQLMDAVNAASHLAFDANRAVAVLIAQQMIGFKDWHK